MNEIENCKNKELALQLRASCLFDIEKGTDQIGRDTLAFANGIHC